MVEFLGLPSVFPISFCMVQATLYSLNEIAENVIGSDLIARRTGNDSVSDSADNQYFIKNHLGSTVTMVDKEGQIVGPVYDYFPYGKQKLAVAAPEKVTQTYTGKELDLFEKDEADGEDGEGWYYFGARYYDADVGMWTSVDPAEEFWTPYRYTTNPIGFIDIQGLAEFRVALYMTDQETPSGDIQNVNWGTIDLASIELNVNMNLHEGDNFKMQVFNAETKSDMLKFIGEGDVSAILAHGGARSPNVGDVVQSGKKNLVSLSSLDNASKGKTYVYSCGAPEAIKNTGDYKKLEPGANTSGHPQLSTMFISIIKFFSNGAKDQ